MTDKQSQTIAVKRHLLRHNSITPLQALRKYGVFRLAARIRDLRKAHFAVTTCMVSKKGKRFAKYVMG